MCVHIMVRADVVKSQPLLQDMTTDVPHPSSEIRFTIPLFGIEDFVVTKPTDNSLGQAMSEVHGDNVFNPGVEVVYVKVLFTVAISHKLARQSPSYSTVEAMVFVWHAHR